VGSIGATGKESCKFSISAATSLLWGRGKYSSMVDPDYPTLKIREAHRIREFAKVSILAVNRCSVQLGMDDS
jgi:hypothetical protein